MTQKTVQLMLNVRVNGLPVHGARFVFFFSPSILQHSISFALIENYHKFFFIFIQCSKPCGGGDMTRKVICMKDDVVVPASNCDVDSIMFRSEDCNKHPCDDGKYFFRYFSL